MATATPSPAPTYLVTGAAGFIGARFVESCPPRGIATVSVDKLSHFTERTEHRGVEFGKRVDRDLLFEWLTDSANALPLTAIVHLGACSRTTEMDREFLRRNNVEYSQRLWNFARMRGIPFVYASSAATYGNGEHGYDDDEALAPRLKPLNPYGESKWIFDQWALAEERAGRHPPEWAGFKFFNVYGFGERHKGSQSSVVLQGFDQVRARGGIRLFESHRAGIANGHQARDFIWVDDVVRVLHFAVERALREVRDAIPAGKRLRGIYNLGTGQARTFLDLAKAVFAALHLPERIEFAPTPAHLREQYQYFTEARMERLRTLGYTQPFTALEEGVRHVVTQLAAAEAKPVPAPPSR
jgi:ADP-L-glycero-D-manno-heptose 6-epimerase